MIDEAKEEAYREDKDLWWDTHKVKPAGPMKAKRDLSWVKNYIKRS